MSGSIVEIRHELCTHHGMWQRSRAQSTPGHADDAPPANYIEKSRQSVADLHADIHTISEFILFVPKKFAYDFIKVEICYNFIKIAIDLHIISSVQWHGSTEATFDSVKKHVFWRREKGGLNSSAMASGIASLCIVIGVDLNYR